MMRKNVYLEAFRGRYKRANRKGKSQLLNELCDLYGYNRKYLLQYFNHLTNKKYVRRGAKRRYDGKELLEALKHLWLASDQMCSKRLKAAIPLWLPGYEEIYGSCLKKLKGNYYPSAQQA